MITILAFLVTGLLFRQIHSRGPNYPVWENTCGYLGVACWALGLVGVVKWVSILIAFVTLEKLWRWL